MTGLLLAVLLAATPVQPPFQCGMDDAACWRRMTLWEYNERVAAEQNRDAAASAAGSQRKRAEKCEKNTRSNGTAFGLGMGGGALITAIILGLLLTR